MLYHTPTLRHCLEHQVMNLPSRCFPQSVVGTSGVVYVFTLSLHWFLLPCTRVSICFHCFYLTRAVSFLRRQGIESQSRPKPGHSPRGTRWSTLTTFLMLPLDLRCDFSRGAKA
ncbi:hypothetical protein BDR03DRAFT_970961 [Suillus americanus]|nr:hypothetical protein BDR03DRAFT_970961 [Suillus americanus]